MLQRAACGFGSLAFTDLLARASTGELPLAHFAPRAKRMVFLFMQGGPSHVDTFDPKPRLQREAGQERRFRVARTRQVTAEKVLPSPWKFQRHGESGRWVSELVPEMASWVDQLCFLHGVHTEGVAHGPATLFLHTGATNLVRPSLGSWLSYGLGTENENLPAFVTVHPTNRMGGPRNWGSAFLPARHRGTSLGRVGIRMQDARFPYLEPLDRDRDDRSLLDLVQEVNREQLARRDQTEDLKEVLNSYELAFRMQTAAPELTGLENESAATRALYGIGQSETDGYGRQCLLARRFLEAGVRYVQVSYSDDSNNPGFDQHSNLPSHEKHCRAIDRPVAGLLADLQSRGMLEDTLVWWGGEFGRTPFAEKKGTGRDHNPDGFTVWLAGAGVKGGFAYGATDEYGQKAVDGRVHMHDLHATVLHLMGLDHERLTHRWAGRDFRLTDVAGRVVREILA